MIFELLGKVCVILIDKKPFIVLLLGVHYGGYDRVQAALTDQDKAFLKKYMTKPKDNKEAFLEFVQGLSEWMPQSMTAAYN